MLSKGSNRTHNPFVFRETNLMANSMISRIFMWKQFQKKKLCYLFSQIFVKSNYGKESSKNRFHKFFREKNFKVDLRTGVWINLTNFLWETISKKVATKANSQFFPWIKYLCKLVWVFWKYSTASGLSVNVFTNNRIIIIHFPVISV